MKSIRRQIFGKNILFLSDNDKIFYDLQAVFCLYPEVTEGNKIEIEVFFTTDKSIKADSIIHNNPKDHYTYKDGFGIDYGGFFTSFHCNNKIRIVCLMQNTSFVDKLRSIGYSNATANLSLIVHEFILLPIMHFFPELAPLHVAAFKNNLSGDLLLFGGTGGVGKTSLELLFCGESNYSFVSDDMAVINTSLEVYPNLSFPKIYAYNLVANKLMTKRLLKDRNALDLMHWYTRKKIKGLSSVRRSVPVDVLYKYYETNKIKATKYYMLFRTNTVDKIKIEKLNKESAINNNISILKNEYYSTFYRKIDLYTYNCSVGNLIPLVSMSNLEKNLSVVFDHFFSTVESYIIKIPLNIDEGEYLRYFKNEFNI